MKRTDSYRRFFPSVLCCLIIASGFTGVAQPVADSVKIKTAINYIKDNAELRASIKRSIHKDAVNFAVSENIVDNYRPLLYFEREMSDSMNLSDVYIDSITKKIPADYTTKILFAKRLSVKAGSKYSLYCSKPVDNLLLCILEYDGNYNPRRKYMGIGRQPFMVFFRFHDNGSIREVFYGSWIID
jgi:hypothetical protein